MVHILYVLRSIYYLVTHETSTGIEQGSPLNEPKPMWVVSFESNFTKQIRTQDHHEDCNPATILVAELADSDFILVEIQFGIAAF